jgi:formamidopyrimidine-DNA glycosylase
MPELPEVETTAFDLRPDLVGRKITGVHVLWERTIAEPGVNEFVARLVGLRVESVGRRGKFLLFGLDSGETLVIHLRMTGQLQIVPSGSPVLGGRHARAWFSLADGRHLVFTDQRKFGRIWLVDDLGQMLAKLGPEPLNHAFTAKVLGERIRGRVVAIKSLLLDQRVVAGIGNIYADESLFLAGIHPRRTGASLTHEELLRLRDAISQVLSEAIGERGTTLRDYRPPYGDKGHYQDHRRVYQRTDEPCPTCTTPIVRTVIAQRSAHFCPHCQTDMRPSG